MKQENFLEYKDYRIVYKRYASLYFCVAVDPDDNELIVLEIVHRYVELLDKYFGSVCELDIIFNFEKEMGLNFYTVDYDKINYTDSDVFFKIENMNCLKMWQEKCMKSYQILFFQKNLKIKKLL